METTLKDQPKAALSSFWHSWEDQRSLFCAFGRAETNLSNLEIMGGIRDHVNTLGLQQGHQGRLERVGFGIIMVKLEISAPGLALAWLGRTFRVTPKKAFKNCGKNDVSNTSFHGQASFLSVLQNEPI